MDRRKALKTIGIGAGTITVTPTVVGIFQSCQKNRGKYIPTYFSDYEFSIVSKLMELIIPKTDIPGAIELKLPHFLDGYVDVIFSKSAKQQISFGLDQLLGVAKNYSGKKTIKELETDDLEHQLARFLKASDSKQRLWNNEFKNYQKNKNTIDNTKIPNDAVAFSFLEQLRSLTITAFRTNEFIGENVLAYAPIPGEQIGCIDLKKATGGKAWSL